MGLYHDSSKDYEYEQGTTYDLDGKIRERQERQYNEGLHPMSQHTLEQKVDQDPEETSPEIRQRLTEHLRTSKNKTSPGPDDLSRADRDELQQLRGLVDEMLEWDPKATFSRRFRVLAESYEGCPFNFPEQP